MNPNADYPPGNYKMIWIALSFVIINSCNHPRANFEADNTAPRVGEEVKLIDMSENDPDTWEWDLNPGFFDYLQGTGPGSRDPIVQFNEAGSYSVTLSVSNQQGSDTKTKADYITVLNDYSPIVKVYSPGLEDNLLGDSPEREVRVYLPPAYFENTSVHYPVIYLLHGFFGDHNTYYTGIEDVQLDIEESLNTLIGNGSIKPMIVVTPNAYNRYFGSKYVNSTSTGRWEDFVAQDVVQYIDAHFRTLPGRESRGIGGHSMGGYGAFQIAMKHPGLFGVLYAQSAADMSFEDIFFGFMKPALVTASQLAKLTLSDLLLYGFDVGACVAAAPAYAPNPDAPPFYGDFPVTENGDKIDSTWQRWLEHDPCTMLTIYQENLKEMNAVMFDCGTSDVFFPSNSIFSQALTAHGVDHTFDEYDGTHLNRLKERLETDVFPFFSLYLDHE